MPDGLKRILTFSILIFVSSIGYYIYASLFYPPVEEKQTWLSEIGEGFGEIGLWLLCFIYLRTLLKLALGKGAMSRRLMPEYSPQIEFDLSKKFIGFLDRTHIYFGVSAVAVISLHIALMGIPMHILFFPAVLVLIIWQGLFGTFIAWRYTPKEVRKFSYLVHAQLFTGIMIGVFSLLGHALIDD